MIKGVVPVSCAKIQPAPALRDMVCYWHLTSHGKRRERPLISVPDEHMEIILDFYPAPGNPGTRFYGMQQESEKLCFNGPVDIVKIKFLPGGFFRLFRRSADAFAGKSAPLRDVFGKTAGLFGSVMAKKTPSARARAVDEILLAFAPGLPMDEKIAAALSAINESGGLVRVGELARRAGWTERWFCAKFKQWVGIGPRFFCLNVKFRNALIEFNRNRKTLSQVAAEAGFSDHSHFSRLFKSRIGITPEEFLRRRRA